MPADTVFSPLTPTEVIRRELGRFLEDDKPGVIAIRGRWGVGKTYAWNEALKAAVSNKTIKYDCYSSVSLFGIESLDKLKFTIFENKTYREKIGHEPDIESITKTWGSIGEKIVAVVGGNAASDVVKAGVFVSVRKQIVCIDDVERKGKDLRTMDVLGLASFLRERRGCKIVLILNEEQLEDEKSELSKYQEKVIESSYLYAPTPTECAEIALRENGLFATELKHHCIRLGISNIRVIKKIESAVTKIYHLLKDYDQHIFYAAIQTLTSFGWARFAEHEPVQPQTVEKKEQRNINEELLTFIISKYAKGLYGATKTASPDEERWTSILEAYEFHTPNALDVLLCEGVRTGYFDEQRIIQQAKILTAALAQGAAREAWNHAFDLFHDSFDNNKSEVVKAFRDSFVGIVKHATAADLNTIMKFFKELGEKQLAQEMLDLFMKERDEEPEFFELDQNIFNSQIDDQDLREAFFERVIILRKTPDPHEILLRIYKQNSWSRSDIRVLSELPVDGYYEIFKMPLGEDHRRLVNAALGFRQYANPMPEFLTIVQKSTDALQRIAKESDLNRIRVRGFGVNFDAIE